VVFWCNARLSRDLLTCSFLGGVWAFLCWRSMAMRVLMALCAALTSLSYFFSSVVLLRRRNVYVSWAGEFRLVLAWLGLGSWWGFDFFRLLTVATFGAFDFLKLLGVARFGAFYFYNRWVLQGLAWVLQDLVLNKCGCTRLPASCLGGYCSGSVGLDVFGLWEISFFSSALILLGF